MWSGPDPVTGGQRLLQLEAVAVRVAGELLQLRLDRLACQGAHAERVFVGRELDDTAFLQPHLSGQLGDRLAWLVRGDGANIRRG